MARFRLLSLSMGLAHSRSWVLYYLPGSLTVLGALLARGSLVGTGELLLCMARSRPVGTLLDLGSLICDGALRELGSLSRDGALFEDWLAQSQWRSRTD